MRKTAVFGAASIFVVALAVTAMASADSGAVFLNTIWFPPGQPNIAPYAIWWDGGLYTLTATSPLPASPEVFSVDMATWEGNKMVQETLVASKFEPQNTMHGNMATFYQYLRTTAGPWFPSGPQPPGGCQVEVWTVPVEIQVGANSITLFPSTNPWMEEIGESGMALFGVGNPIIYGVDSSCQVTEWELATSTNYPNPIQWPYTGVYVAQAAMMP